MWKEQLVSPEYFQQFEKRNNFKIKLLITKETELQILGNSCPIYTENNFKKIVWEKNLLKNVDICMCVTDSLCCTAETIL